MTRIKLTALILICISLGIGLVQAETLSLNEAQRSSVELTIYNDNLVLVNDRYQVLLPSGNSALDFSAISPLITPASAVLHSLPEGVSVSHQYYQSAMTPLEMLRGSVGQTVSLVRTHPQTGEQISQRATLLGVDEGLILEIDGRFETELAGRRIVYDQLPPGVLKPTLSIGIDSVKQQAAEPVLSYLAGGLSWRTDYTASLNAAQDRLDLRALATLSNHSGLDYSRARIELVAGSVNRVAAAGPRAGAALKMAAMESDAVVSPDSLGDLYLYSLPGQHDLANNSTRQLRLFSIQGIPVEKRYRLTGTAGVYFSPIPGIQTLKADSYVEFDNVEIQQTDQPMPGGTVRVYSRANNASGGLKFIGADRIEHTPIASRVRLKTGRAFDISATRQQLAYQRLPVEQPYRQHNEIKLLTVIHNAQAKAVSVQVAESFSGEWKLVGGPQPDQHDARSASWNVLVPAGSKAELRLTIRVKR